MPSKRRSKSKQNKNGYAAECDHCKTSTIYYVITGTDNVWCLDCLGDHGWEHLRRSKATTKGGGSTGSKRTVPKRIANLSGQLGGDFQGDIKIETKDGFLIAESKYQATGRGFGLLTTTHKNQPSDLYLLKQKTGPHFICIEVSNPLAEKIVGWITGR